MTRSTKPLARFDQGDAVLAYDNWGANCGPGALAAIMDMTLDEVRAHLGDFETKGYTNPALMHSALRSIGRPWRKVGAVWPSHGLVRVQWEGPWTEPGVPMRARYRHTHWIGVHREGNAMWIFDINCMCAGGWVDHHEWANLVVPWLLKQCEPESNGRWHITHAVEVERAS